MLTLKGIKNKNYLKEREEIFKNLSKFPLPNERYTDLRKIPFDKYLKIKEEIVLKDEITPSDNVIFFPEFFEYDETIKILKKVFEEHKNRILATHFVFPTGGIFINIENKEAEYELNLKTPTNSTYSFQTYIFKVNSSSLKLKINTEQKGDYFSHNLFIFLLDNGSHVKVMNFVKSEISYLFNSFFSFIRKDSNFEIYSSFFENPYTKSDKFIIIEGEGAEINIKDIFLTRKNMFLSLRNDLIFRKNYTKGEEYSKGILLDESVAAFYGLARVDENLKKINAFVEGDALLLSDKASFLPVPSLEILSNDLRCTHAVNSGPVSEEKIFYMTSRGLKREDAIKMYVESYLLSNIENAEKEFKEKVKDYLNSIEIKSD